MSNLHASAEERKLLPTASERPWVTATVLHTLAARGLTRGSRFTGADLAAWLDDTLATAQRWHATSRLCSLGMLAHEVSRPPEAGGDQVDTYTVTADGAAAIEAARQGQVRRSGPKGSRRPNPVRPESFVARLWALMRLRRMLTPEEAAATLCDAGDEAAVRRAQDTARKTLRRWAQAGAVAESARRIGAQGHSNGHKRYVLQVDSVQPPRWRQASKTGGAA